MICCFGDSPFRESSTTMAMCVSPAPIADAEVFRLAVAALVASLPPDERARG